MITNAEVRTRLKNFINEYPIPLKKLGELAGLGEHSPYLVSRFMKGLELNTETLKLIDDYLTRKGY